MARGNSFFKAQFNQVLDQFAVLDAGSVLGSEAELARMVGASRTTIRAILSELSERKIIHWQGRVKALLRQPLSSDYFVESETVQPSQQVESLFLEWIFKSDLPPGETFSEVELARRFRISTGAVREFLIRFEPFGLIGKQPNRHWVLKGFTKDFANEMFDVREMFEQRALEKLMADPLSDIEREDWFALKRQHEAIQRGSDEDTFGFPALDAVFHETLCAAADNRFIFDFARTISIIVHYHYQWNKRDEVVRNRAAAAEHILIIEAILLGDRKTAREALDLHLKTARGTLLASVNWAVDQP